MYCLTFFGNGPFRIVNLGFRAAKILPIYGDNVMAYFTIGPVIDKLDACVSMF